MTAKRPLLLDLFCGAGGCAVGYHRAGFDVVGVDHKPQSRYPFSFIQADALKTLELLLCGTWAGDDNRAVLLESVAAIHASPPCQRYSVSQHIHQSGDRHPDLVAPTRRLLEQTGKPWVIENTAGAPLDKPSRLCGLMFGLRVLRHRWFECSFLLMTPPHPKHPPGNLTNSCHGYSTGSQGFVTVAGNNFVRAAGAKAMGIDWGMSRPELAQAIPPAFTRFVGIQLLTVLCQEPQPQGVG